MSAVNASIDRRAAARDGDYPHDLPDRADLEGTVASLRNENTGLRRQLEQQTLDHREDARLLRGLSKLVMAAYYNPQNDVLTITPLELHSDAEVSAVWGKIRAAQRESADR